MERGAGRGGEGDFELQHHVNFSQRGRGKLASIFPLVVFPFPLLLLYLLSCGKYHPEKKENNKSWIETFLISSCNVCSSHSSLCESLSWTLKKQYICQNFRFIMVWYSKKIKNSVLDFLITVLWSVLYLQYYTTIAQPIFQNLGNTHILILGCTIKSKLPFILIY